MEKLQVMREKSEEFIFKIKNDNIQGLEIELHIRKNKKERYIWEISAGIHYWNNVRIHGKEFTMPNGSEYFSENGLDEINKSSYELFRLLKTHPKYRLKLMNMLNDEIKEIWKVV